MADFHDLEDVQRWVDKHRDGAAYLRKTLAEGRLSTRNSQIASAWLDRHAEGLRSDAEALKSEREERATNAAEVSADATVDAAQTARKSLALSRAALWISLAAFVLSAWPLIAARL